MVDHAEDALAPGAPGYNKQLRDSAKHALAITALLIATGNLLFALLSSGYAIYTLKVGTLFSSKNAKWMTISILSFCVSLLCIILDAGVRIVDENRDYSFHTRLRFWYLALKSAWWPILVLFLVCTWGSTAGKSTATELQGKKIDE